MNLLVFQTVRRDVKRDARRAALLPSLAESVPRAVAPAFLLSLTSAGQNGLTAPTRSTNGCTVTHHG
jgi:hypothetical protein